METPDNVSSAAGALTTPVPPTLASMLNVMVPTELVAHVSAAGGIESVIVARPVTTSRAPASMPSVNVAEPVVDTSASDDNPESVNRADPVLAY